MDFAVDSNGHEFVCVDVFELHNLVAVAGQLSPAARLVGILLDGLVLVTVNLEGDGAKAMSAGATYWHALAGEVDPVAVHQLLSDGG